MRRVLALLFTALLTACGSVRQIRTDIPAAAPRIAAAHLPPPELSPTCETGSRRDGERSQVIEDYGNYLLGFAEFDDQGWSFDHDRQLDAIQRRLQAELADPRQKEIDFAVIVYVHGWHHNARDNDCNVQEMRQMIKLSAAAFDAAYQAGKLKRPRRVVGIYAGWRGESVDAPGLRYATVIDRRDVAEKVAKGSIRQLFANLHVLESRARAAAADRLQLALTADTEIDQADRMFTTIVGHSFGGLVVFNSLSEGLVDTLTDACSPDLAAPVLLPRKVWPDEVVLINPAFEASRFETLHRLAEQSSTCRGLARAPFVTVITADNDRWTGPVFTFGRRFLTLFEDYDAANAAIGAQEKEANLRAIGFVSRYQTHRLCLTETDDAYGAIAYPATLDPADAAAVGTREVWSIRAPRSIVDGHNGFLYARRWHGEAEPYLLNWLIAMHIPGSHPLGRQSECLQDADR